MIVPSHNLQPVRARKQKLLFLFNFLRSVQKNGPAALVVRAPPTGTKKYCTPSNDTPSFQMCCFFVMILISLIQNPLSEKGAEPEDLQAADWWSDQV